MITKDSNQTLPLSLSQREVWLDQMAWPDSAHLNIGGCLDLKGTVDLDLMQEALNGLVKESLSLRTILLSEGKQKVLRSYIKKFEYLDFSDALNSMQNARDWQQNWMREPFKVFDKPPWRFALIKTAEDEHLIVIQFHHFIMDGWGTLQVIQRWAEIYTHLASSAELPNLTVTYEDYIASSNEFLQRKSDKERIFWEKEFNSVPASLFDKKYRVSRTGSLPDAHLVAHTISKQSYGNCIKAATNLNVTSYHWTIAAIVAYFARTKKQTEITIGVPNLNRTGKKFKSTLGMFVNVLPLKISYDPQQTFAELTQSIASKLRLVYRNARLPVSEMIKQLKTGDTARESVFDIIFSFEKQDYDCLFGNARIVRSHQTFSTYSRYPLGVTLCEFHEEQDIELIVEGNSEYFEYKETQLLAGRLEHILEQSSANPDLRVADIELLGQAEKNVILNEIHKEVKHHKVTQTFIESFESHAKSTPHQTALLNGDIELSYLETNELADVFADRLRQHGVAVGDHVVIYLPRSIDAILTMLAIAKLGAVFIPVDVELPEARVESIVSSASVHTVVSYRNVNSCFGTQNVKFSNQKTTVIADSTTNRVNVKPTSPAYVLFTSGTTGIPKGVVISHQTLANRLNYIAEQWQVTPRDRSAQMTLNHFDPSLIEILMPLTKGASIAVPESGRLDPERMGDFAEKFKVTFMAYVPLTLARFLNGINYQSLNLRIACCGGEALSFDLATRFVNKTGATLYNVYGPTETCIYSTAHSIGSYSRHINMPVGKPVDNTRIYVLDEKLDLVPIGVSGNVYIGGDALTEGYIGHETNDKLKANPFVSGERIYHTGDLGWLDCDGVLHFGGRADRQVKLRGYRIELQEIESCLLALPYIESAAVAIRGEANAQFIGVWVVCKQGYSQDDIHHELVKRLPDYMVPSQYNLVDKLPSTTSGKVDYHALTSSNSNIIKLPIRSAIGPTETSLLSIWKKVLKREEISVKDNFFQLGGDSLSAIIMLTKIESELAVKLPLSDFVANPTIQTLAKVIDSDKVTAKMIVSLGEEVNGQSLYIAASGHGDLLRFTALAESLKGVCDVFMLQPPEQNSPTNFEDLAALYADIIVSRNVDNIYMAGFSVGGITALETSRLLRANGIKVNELFLIDTIMFKLPPGAVSIWKGVSSSKQFIKRLFSGFKNNRVSTISNDKGLYSQVMAMKSYKPQNYEGLTTLIKTSILTHFDKLFFARWRSTLNKSLNEEIIEGKHGTIFNPGSVQQLASVLIKQIYKNSASENSHTFSKPINITKRISK